MVQAQQQEEQQQYQTGALVLCPKQQSASQGRGSAADAAAELLLALQHCSAAVDSLSFNVRPDLPNFRAMRGMLGLTFWLPLAVQGGSCPNGDSCGMAHNVSATLGAAWEREGEERSLKSAFSTCHALCCCCCCTIACAGRVHCQGTARGTMLMSQRSCHVAVLACRSQATATP
jgi:hypothetical protein